MLQDVGRPALLGPAVLLVGYLVYQFLYGGPKLPKLPIIGARKGDWFPLIQARWRNLMDSKSGVIQAETEFKDQAVLFPVAGTGDIVMLPRAETQFVTDQPETVLDMHAAVVESMQFMYTSANPELISNPIHHKLITTTLTNQIGNLVPEVADETAYCLDRDFGSPEDWTDVCIYKSMLLTIAGVTNRVFVGKPKCRDMHMLNQTLEYAHWLPIIGQLLRNTWKPLRPVFAWFLTIPIHRITRAFHRSLLPEIKPRLVAYDARREDPEAKSQLGPEPNDFLQWCIQQAKEMGDPYLWDSRTLANRILLVNFAALHTSSMAITAVILELMASKQAYIDELRAEIEGVLAEYGGEWNKRGLARMEKLDSALRESARLNSFVTVGLTRQVVPRDGITTPVSNLHLPQGATVAVPSYTVLRDAELYPDPYEFKPFRFSAQRDDDSVDYVKRANKAWVATSKEYLAFGHGRTACPGRFFAANELKLILAYFILNYDIEVTGPGSRPRNKWYGLIRIPPMEAKIRIRRRVKA
ncbi:cytochrome P450 [Echria macrotheca]|uniref:Cytochrome P450 n=1 Tax=Echria macrotheca TaxID=438768 RepID=A0AAJ0B1W8_9PEZI|nr:cytochrome P450 [Echria macrotheca]